MQRFVLRCSFVMACGWAILPGRSASAAPIVAGTDVVHSTAVQTIDLFPGTPFNPGPNTLTVVLTAHGSFAMDREAQVGSTIDFTIPTALFSGVLPGPLPPFPFDLVAGTTGLNPSIGQISNVVQDPASPGFPSGSPTSFVSGDFSANTYFALILPIATLYSDPNQPAVFTSALAGLPLPAGTVLASPERLNIYLQTGPGFDPTRDPVIGQSYNRTVTATAVPEPSTFVMLLGGVLLLGIARGKRQMARR